MVGEEARAGEPGRQYSDIENGRRGIDDRLACGGYPGIRMHERAMAAVRILDGSMGAVRTYFRADSLALSAHVLHWVGACVVSVWYVPNMCRCQHAKHGR